MLLQSQIFVQYIFIKYLSCADIRNIQIFQKVPAFWELMFQKMRLKHKQIIKLQSDKDHMVVYPKGYRNIEARMIDQQLHFLRFSVLQSSTDGLYVVRNMDLGLKKETGARAGEFCHCQRGWNWSQPQWHTVQHNVKTSSRWSQTIWSKILLW